MAGSIKGLSFKEITAGIGGMVSGLGTLAKAILANPILLLASVIIAIAMNFDKLLKVFPGLNEALNGVSEELSNQLDAQTKAYEQSKKNLDAIGEQEETLKRMGLTEAEILDKKIAAAEETKKDLEARLLTQKQIVQDQIATAQRNRDILKGMLEFITFPIQALLGSVDMLTEKLHSFGVISDEIYNSVGNLRDRFNTSIAEMVFDPEQVAADGAKTLEEMDNTLKALKNTEDGYRNQKDAKAKAASDKAKADRDKEAEDQKKSADEVHAILLQLEQETADEEIAIANRTSKAIKEAKEQRLNDEEALQEEIYQASLSAQDKELQAIRDAYFEKIALAEQYGLDSSVLVEDQKKKEAEINTKYNEIDTAANQKVIDEKKANINAWIHAIGESLGALVTLSESFNAKSKKDAKRQFEINKGLSIANAVIKTYEGAQAAFATGSATGVPGLGFVYAGIAIAAGLANINKIRQSKFDENGGGGPGPSTTPPPSTGGGGNIAPSAAQQPQFSALNTSFLNNKPNQVTPQAYVLAGGVASSLEAEQKIRDRARL